MENVGNKKMINFFSEKFIFYFNRFRTRDAAWMNALQGKNSMHDSVQLGDNWVAVIPKALSRDAEAFIREILNVSRGMNFNVQQPRV